jgi:alkylation response protein AidB-like acyl-CoA dehydrogenase
MILKLLGSETLQRVCEFALAVAGDDAVFDDERLFDDFEALGATIYGGTSEIQRNIIGERLLGLPRG